MQGRRKKLIDFARMVAETSLDVTRHHGQSQETDMTLGEQFAALGMDYPEEALLTATRPQPVFRLWPENQKVARYFLEIWGIWRYASGLSPVLLGFDWTQIAALYDLKGKKIKSRHLDLLRRMEAEILPILSQPTPTTTTPKTRA